jgi:hypothetical protein
VSYVDGGDGIAVVLGVLEELEDIIASDDTSLAGENLLSLVVSCCSPETWCFPVMTYVFSGNHCVCDV